MPAHASISAQGVIPERALAYWSDAATQRAFAVAGLAKQDMLAELHASIHEAIKSGETLASWKKRIGHILKETGWTGHRVETIFRTNVQTAYMAGRYAQMREVAKSRPYWQYLAVGDTRTRPNHAALSGMVFHADDPFWDTNYPPNGFRCRCAVRTLSARQVEKMGLEIREGMPRDLLYTDPKTGMEIHLASVLPDTGFAANPGKDWLAGLSPGEIDGGQVADLTGAATCKGSGNFASGDTCRPPLATLPAKHILPIKPGDILPRGMTEEAYALAFLKEFGLKRLTDSSLVTLPGVNHPLVIDRGLFTDKATGALKANKKGRGPFLKLLARTIKNPFEIWLVPVSLSGKSRAVLRLIRLFADEKQQVGGFGVFSVAGREWHGNTLFNPKGQNAALMLEYLEKQRVGTLLYREGE